MPARSLHPATSDFSGPYVDDNGVPDLVPPAPGDMVTITADDSGQPWGTQSGMTTGTLAPGVILSLTDVVVSYGCVLDGCTILMFDTSFLNNDVNSISGGYNGYFQVDGEAQLRSNDYGEQPNTVTGSFVFDMNNNPSIPIEVMTITGYISLDGGTTKQWAEGQSPATGDVRNNTLYLLGTKKGTLNTSGGSGGGLGGGTGPTTTGPQYHNS